MEHAYGFKFALSLDLLDSLMNNHINYAFLFESNGFRTISYPHI